MSAVRFAATAHAGQATVVCEQIEEILLVADSFGSASAFRGRLFPPSIFRRAYHCFQAGLT
jgi:hypothetical protein